MSELARLLELLHGADESWSTLRARYRVVRHRERAQAAFLAAARRSGATISTFGRGAAAPAPAPVESEEVVSLWLERPHRARGEHAGGARDGAYGVRDGELWWSWDPRRGATSNSADPTVGSDTGRELELLFAPAPLLGALRFELVGQAALAGREAIVADARPRLEGRQTMPRDIALAQLGRGAERYRLQIDSERGLILACQAIRYEEPFHTIEALELELDLRLPEETFEFVAPEGEEVQPPGSHRSELRRHCSIAEVQALAPFTVLVPERVPTSWTVHCTYFGGSERPPSGPGVSIHYRSDSGHEDLNISEGLADDFARQRIGTGEDWEEVTAGDRRVRVRGRGEQFPQSQLVLEHRGTHVLMVSNGLSREQLIALARVLEPAPGASVEG
jgi:hypothetical protein